MLKPEWASFDIAIVVLFLGKDEDVECVGREKSKFRWGLLPIDFDRVHSLGDICAQIVIVETLTCQAKLGKFTNKNLSQEIDDQYGHIR